MSAYFPGYQVGVETYLIVVGAACVIGCLAAGFPVQRALSIRIVDGLRVVD